MGKLDYVAAMIETLGDAQKAIQQAGKTVTQHADGGYTPFDKINALSVLMDEVASTDPNLYKMYRRQRKDLVNKYGAPGPKSDTSSTRNPDTDELKRIVNNYQSENSGASLEVRMSAAASAGDMATYKQLREERKLQQQA